MTAKTADYIWFNGEMVPWAEANRSRPDSRNALRYFCV